MKKKGMRKRVFVVPKRGKGWAVKEGRETVQEFSKKEEAVRFGRDLAKSAPLSQLVIHKKDGTIQEERTYGRDPFPPEG